MRTLLRDLMAFPGARAAALFQHGGWDESLLHDSQAAPAPELAVLAAEVLATVAAHGDHVADVTLEADGHLVLMAPVHEQAMLVLVVDPSVPRPTLAMIGGSAVRQARAMLGLAEVAASEDLASPAAPTPMEPRESARGASPPPAESARITPAPTGRPPSPAARWPLPQRDRPLPPAPEAAVGDAEPVLPQVLALLADAMGPLARVTFRRGVARWRRSHAPTLDNLGELARILAVEFEGERRRRDFVAAVEKLRGDA